MLLTRSGLFLSIGYVQFFLDMLLLYDTLCCLTLVNNIFDILDYLFFRCGKPVFTSGLLSEMTWRVCKELASGQQLVILQCYSSTVEVCRSVVKE